LDVFEVDNWMIQLVSEETMKRRHPWAALRDFAGNLRCGLWHRPTHWQWKYPGPFASPIGQLLNRLIVCRYGREWSVDETGEKFIALTHRHLDAARAQRSSGD
jgi:hypothetical protein